MQNIPLFLSYFYTDFLRDGRDQNIHTHLSQYKTISIITEKVSLTILLLLRMLSGSNKRIIFPSHLQHT